MYKPGTVLTLREPQSTKDQPFPYDRVRVIGPSPVAHAAAGSWDGVGAQGVVIAPVDEFAANIDEPYGKLQELYNVESEPEQAPIIQGRVIEVQDGPSPEEQFAAAAKAKPKARAAAKATNE